MANISDFLFNSSVANTGTWVRLVNNSTGLAYISTAATNSSGQFTITGVPSGSYTLQTGVTSTGPWVPTFDTNYIVPASVLSIFTLTDQANIFPDASLGDYFKLSAGGSRSIKIPANPVTGQVIRFDIKNNTSGSITTTWDAVFLLASIWTDAAAGARKIVTFVYDGTNWVEQTRSNPLDLSISTLTVSSKLSALNIEGIQFADQFSGANAGAQIAAAQTALGANGGLVINSSSMTPPITNTTTWFNRGSKWGGAVLDLRQQQTTSGNFTGFYLTDGGINSGPMGDPGLGTGPLVAIGTTDIDGLGGRAPLVVKRRLFNGQWTAGGGGTLQLVGDALLVGSITQPSTDTLTYPNFINSIEANAVVSGTSLNLYDFRNITAAHYWGQGGLLPTGSVGDLVNFDAQSIAAGITTNGTLHLQRYTNIRAEWPGIPTTSQQPLGFTGTATATLNSTSLNWLSGDPFTDRGMIGYPITITDGVHSLTTYVVSVTWTAGNLTSAVLVLGAQWTNATTTVTWTIAGNQYAAELQGAWIRADQPTMADSNGGNGLLVDVGATNTTSLWLRNKGATRLNDGSLPRMAMSVDTGGNLSWHPSTFSTVLAQLYATGRFDLSQGVTVTTQAGLLNLGGGGFTGGANNFNGNSSGTVLAMNLGSGYAGDFLNIQKAGTSVVIVNNVGTLTTRAGTATTGGGVIGMAFGSSPSLGVYFGSGSPTVSAPQGSLYLRTDGTTTNNRAYINTDGATTWTALTTVA